MRPQADGRVDSFTGKPTKNKFAAGGDAAYKGGRAFDDYNTKDTRILTRQVCFRCTVITNPAQPRGLASQEMSYDQMEILGLVVDVNIPGGLRCLTSERAEVSHIPAVREVVHARPVVAILRTFVLSHAARRMRRGQ